MIFKRKNYIRWFLILSVALVSALVFFSLAEDVFNREELTQIDPVIGAFLLSKTSLAGSRVFLAITYLGNALVISLGTAILSAWLIRQKLWSQLIFLLVVVAGCAVINLGLKDIFLRSRPDYLHAFIKDVGYSFPSGHAMISVAFYGGAAYLLIRRLHDWKAKVCLGMGVLVIAFLIGMSRLYLGVHYLTDVIAGWAIATSWLALCIFAAELARFREEQKGPARIGQKASG
jgi:undecaprenyl-diphosphatase